jgi:hypothetical protein
MDLELKQEVARLVHDLAAKRYRELVVDGRGGRLSEQEMQTAITGYGRTLLPLPEEAWSLVDLYEQVGGLALDVPLWTVQEGRSDLTLSLSVKNSMSGYTLTIDDIHVL